MYYQCLVTLENDLETSATLHFPRIPIKEDEIELTSVFPADPDDTFTVTKVLLFAREHQAMQHGTAAWVVVKRQGQEGERSLEFNIPNTVIDKVKY